MPRFELTDCTNDELHLLIAKLRGHGGWSPLSPATCQLCLLKDDARQLLKKRGYDY